MNNLELFWIIMSIFWMSIPFLLMQIYWFFAPSSIDFSNLVQWHREASRDLNSCVSKERWLDKIGTSCSKEPVFSENLKASFICRAFQKTSATEGSLGNSPYQMKDSLLTERINLTLLLLPIETRNEPSFLSLWWEGFPRNTNLNTSWGPLSTVKAQFLAVTWLPS